MRVYISVDAEGITGIYKLSQVIPGNNEYGFARKMMIGDVNAAVRGAFNAGATEVIINDAHNQGDNLLLDQLDPRVKLISGTDRPFSMMEGIDRGFDAALLIGYHLRKGKKGVINHTYFYSHMVEARINKKPVSEYELNGLIAGHYNIPVVFISGDNLLVKDAEENIPGVYSTVTKEAIGVASALCLPPETTWKSIEQNVEKALVNFKKDNIKPMKVESEKIELEVVFANTGYATHASWFPGFELVDDRTIRYVADNYLEMFKAFIAGIYLSTTFKETV